MKNIKIGDCFQGQYVPVLVVDSDHPFAERCFLLSDLNGHSQYMLENEIQKKQCLPTLHLPIGNSPKYGGCWFDLILGGVKKEEYREVWGQNETGRNIPILTTRSSRDARALYRIIDNDPRFISMLSSEVKPFKVIHLTNGYGHDKPQLWAHIESISIGRGNPEWGAPTDRDVFIIRIGEVFHSKNLKAK